MIRKTNGLWELFTTEPSDHLLYPIQWVKCLHELAYLNVIRNPCIITTAHLQMCYKLCNLNTKCGILI